MRGSGAPWRYLFAFLWGLVLFVVPAWALAQDEKEVVDLNAVHVCVMPSWLQGTIYWSYGAGGKVPVKLTIEKFKERTAGFKTFVYDPYAPPENTLLLEPPEKFLKCAPPPPRPAPPVAKKPEKKGEGGEGGTSEKKGDEKKPGAEGGGGSTTGQPMPKKTPEEIARDEAERKAAQIQAELEEKAKARGTPRLPAQEEARQIPLAKDVQLLPPKEFVLPKAEVVKLPSANEEANKQLPTLKVGREPTPMQTACGECTKAAKERREAKARWEQVVEEAAILAAILNTQMGEDLRREDGKQFGIVGGKDADGFNHPVVQTVAVAIALGSATLSNGKEFLKKVRDAARSKAPLVIKEVDEKALKMAEELADKHGLDLAAALAQVEAIGPYRFMKKFTNKLKGRVEAHHILEVTRAEKLWKMSEAEIDEIPSVILTKEAHQKLSDLLSKAAKPYGKGLTKKNLWEIYQKAYKDHPHWLTAIEEYFK